MQRSPGRPLLAYSALVLAIVIGLALLVLAVGQHATLGRIVWLGVGVLLGGLWPPRSRLPVLNAPNLRVAASGWLGLILASIVTTAIAPATLSFPALGMPARTATAQGQRVVLRPAPPTAVRRTGTLGPTEGTGSARPEASSTAVASARATASPGPRSSPVVARSSPTAVRPAAAPTPSLPASFDPQAYLGQGNAFDCADLSSQAEAQAILRADPTDPNVIDNDRDGIACESNPTPRDTRRVARPGR
jgi:hypothetical protein